MTVDTSENNSTKAGGSIPPAIFVSGCGGSLGDEVNGLYCIASQQVSPAVDMTKWRFCYHKGGDVVKGNLLCYGENCPELGAVDHPKEEKEEEERKEKGLVGWIVARLVGGQIKVIARCVQRPVDADGPNRRLNAKGGFTWEVLEGEEMKEMESMSAQPLHAGQKDKKGEEEKKPEGAVSPTSFVKRQLGLSKPKEEKPNSTFKNGPMNPPPASSAVPGFNNYLLGGLHPFHMHPASLGNWNSPFGTHGDMDNHRASKPSPNSTAPSGSVSPSSRKLRADAPAFIPGSLTPVLGALSPPTLATEPAPRPDASGIVIEKGRKVTWELGRMAEELKGCEPGEGVESSTFCLLKNDNLLSGPPMKLIFYPFGHSKSSPGCLSVAVECIEKVKMKFRLQVGTQTSGAKVLLGNRFHVDMDSAKVMPGAVEGVEDEAVLQAWKFDKLKVELRLEQWID